VLKIIIRVLAALTAATASVMLALNRPGFAGGQFI
jgi:hypothetical protein